MERRDIEHAQLPKAFSHIGLKMEEIEDPVPYVTEKLGPRYRALPGEQFP